MCVSLKPPRPSYHVTFRPARGPNGLACWMALPETPAPGATPLIAVHGIRRGAEQQAVLFADRAAALGRPVIAPLFDRESWLGYQQAFLCGRADLALLTLLAALRRDGVIGPARPEFFGFSGGAQFVHRFAMAHPEKVARLTIASPGWYTFPDNAPYPYGVWPATTELADWNTQLIGNIDDFLALPIRVCVGEYDRVRDKNTRSGPAINAQQGLHRLDRARRWTNAVRQLAARRRVASYVTLHVLKGCGHHFETCVTRGQLDRIVLPEAPVFAAAGICQGTCSAQQRSACRAARLHAAMETGQ